MRKVLFSLLTSQMEIGLRSVFPVPEYVQIDPAVQFVPAHLQTK